MSEASTGRPRSRGYVYILHLGSGLARSNGSAARHYVGWAKNWTRRVEQHRAGTSRARIIEVCLDLGLQLQVAVVVRGGRDLERRIKRSHQYTRYCPQCGGHLVDYRDQEAE